MKSKAERLRVLIQDDGGDGSDYVVNQIIAIFKECVPNEFSHNDKNDEASCNCSWIEGYNDCRFETLKNMEELRG